MANAVLVIDMLRGFLEEGYPLYCGPTARAIVPRIQHLLENELKKGSRIFFLCDHHAPDDLEFQMFPRHCVRGTVEAEVIPELASYPGDVIPKTRYSAFFGTDLEARLKAFKPEKLIVVGVATAICVLHTVADARNRDYPVEVPEDCVADLSPEAHKFALTHMRRILGAKVIASVEVGR